MPRPLKLFISYAHADEAAKDRLRTHLAPMVRTELVELWDDREILAGDAWLARIETAMAGADVALFLLSPAFLDSSFCMEQEIPTLLDRHRGQGVLILYVLVADCLWEDFDFIASFQLLPRDAKPISKQKGRRSDVYTSVAREIRAALKAHPPRPELAPPVHPATPADGLTALLQKLPGQTPHLFGRAEELNQLTAWQQRKGVFLWVAPGGMGKSALTRWWLEQHEWPEGTRFLGHSFYSQGSHNQATSARGFLTAALDQLGAAYQTNAPDDELGRLLAEQVAAAPTVLLLDGLEPLQRAALGDQKLHGTIKDRGLAALLEGLTQHPGQAVCLASSRLPIPDPGIHDAPWYRERPLHALPATGALELLQRRGLKGSELELSQVAQRCGRHPLALVLAAEFCHSFLDDSAAQFLERPWPVMAPGGSGFQPRSNAEKTIAAGSRSHETAHAATLMAWLDAKLNEEQQALDRELLLCIGLFDRPAPWGALLALQQQDPPIPGVTQQLHQAREETLLEALARLRQWGLVQVDLTHSEPDLNAHPLVREHFGAELENQDPAAYCAAHRVLFDWFRNLPEQEQPDTLEALEPLYRAVGHGCRAGAYLTALAKVYRDRIQRGNQRYEQFQLGAWSSDLAALAGFFPKGWGGMPLTGEGEKALSEADRSWLLGEAAFCLMSLGRLEEALRPRRMDLKWCNDEEDWNNFCRSSQGLMDLLTPLGRWDEAQAVALEALEAAGRIADPQQRWQLTMLANAYLGRILRDRGQLGEALEAFGRAEAVQAEARPQEPRLYGLRGFDYAQALLERACRPAVQLEVLERGWYALEIVEGLKHLLSQALDHCTIGQALAALGQMEGNAGAGAALDRAVATMQRAGFTLYLPIMHLARAHQRRRSGDPTRASEDHAAALAIARRGNMRTYLAECALLAAHLHLDTCVGWGEEPTPTRPEEHPVQRWGSQAHPNLAHTSPDTPTPLTQAAAQYAEAARLIREDGYGRREAQLHLLHARLLHHESDPAAARTALEAAEARIREIGQWGLWDELHQVGEEIGVAIPKECPPEAG